MPHPRIFVSHSHKDDTFTERLVADLRQAGADAWMDKTDLGAGDFQDRISQALSDCEWFVLVLTRDALASPWVRQEVDAANRLKNQGQIRDLILVQAGPLEHRELPPLWGVFNIFDATQDYTSACNRTLKAVGLVLQAPIIPADRFPQRLADLGFTAHSSNGVEYILPPLCLIPAGPFLMGSDPTRDKAAEKDEQPQHTVVLAAYEIARFPVTVAEYACFVHAGHRELQNWPSQLNKLDHPVVGVYWHHDRADGDAYAAWLTERTGRVWRLASEAEWEKAARGTDGRIYPWGDTFDESRCNTMESGIKTTTPVGHYCTGDSPYDVHDMAGNVWQWTSSQYLPYPYTISAEREDTNPVENRVLRGGSWNLNARYVRAASRAHLQRGYTWGDFGFRMVRAAPTS